MLSSHMDELRAKLGTVKDSLRTNDALRELLSTQEFRPLKLFPGPTAQDAALRVKYHALNPTTWRTLDHATAMTSLYGAYERFVYDLLKEWLSYLPTIHPRYLDLHAGMRKAHRLGTATILQRIEHRRYQHLSIIDILSDLAAASDGVHPYVLLPEAFFSEDENLRREPLERLFARVGIQDIRSWISGHPEVLDFITNVRGSGNTAESELAEFVGYRNDAAHGNIDEVLGLNAILEIATFIERLCEAISQLVRRTLLKGYVDTGRATVLGKVTEIFHRGATAIGTMKACRIHVNDQVIIDAPDQCSMATVTSLQNHGIDCQEVVAIEGQEVGMRLSVRVRKNVVIARVESDEPFTPDYSI